MPFGTIAAVGLGAAATIGGAVISGNAAKDAAKTEAAAADNSASIQKQEFDQTQATQLQQYNDAIAREAAASGQATGVQGTELAANTALNAPYITSGTSALSQLAGLYGLNTLDASGNVVKGSGPSTDPNATFYQTPDYNFALSQGIKGIDAGAAAGGMLDSGATRKAEIAYAGNLASGQYDNYASRLQQLAGIGQTAASNQQNANTNYASQYSNAVLGAASGSNAAGANYANNITSADTNYANAITGLNTNTANTTANAQLSSANTTAKTINTLIGQAQYALGKNPFGSSYPSTPPITPTTGGGGDGTGAGVLY